MIRCVVQFHVTLVSATTYACRNLPAILCTDSPTLFYFLYLWVILNNYNFLYNPTNFFCIHGINSMQYWKDAFRASWSIWLLFLIIMKMTWVCWVCCIRHLTCVKRQQIDPLLDNRMDFYTRWYVFDVHQPIHNDFTKRFCIRLITFQTCF